MTNEKETPMYYILKILDSYPKIRIHILNILCKNKNIEGIYLILNDKEIINELDLLNVKWIVPERLAQANIDNRRIIIHIRNIEHDIQLIITQSDVNFAKCYAFDKLRKIHI